MTLISLGIVVVVVDLVAFRFGTGGIGTTTKWIVLKSSSTCKEFSGLQAETCARERVQVGLDLRWSDRLRMRGTERCIWEVVDLPGWSEE